MCKLFLRNFDKKFLFLMLVIFSLSLSCSKTNRSREQINNEVKGPPVPSAELPDIKDSGQRRIVRIPAMPEKGFKWPYFLVLPSDKYKLANSGIKRYLLVETTNEPRGKDLTSVEEAVRIKLNDEKQESVRLAEELRFPLLMPAIPRPVIEIYTDENNEPNIFYTTSLDRDSAILHMKMKNPDMKNLLTDVFKKAGHNVHDYIRLDLQVASMIDHAIEYLNKYDHKVEDRVFMYGFSGSGSFSERFSMFHPEKLKAMVAGTKLANMILPLNKYKGRNLIYPIGTYDYEEIAGETFDLEKVNSVARLVFIGENDINDNPLNHMDCYGRRERSIITGLWGKDVIMRAKKLAKLFKKSGGKGMFIVDKSAGHFVSDEMYDYIKYFFNINRENDMIFPPLKSGGNLVEVK